MIKLLSALPNSLLAAQQGELVTIKGLGIGDVKTLLSAGFDSCVGHESTAALFSRLLGVSVTHKRENITFSFGDCLVVGLFTPPRRLNEGEKWTEKEILKMPVNWVKVEKFVSSLVDATESIQEQWQKIKKLTISAKEAKNKFFAQNGYIKVCFGGWDSDSPVFMIHPDYFHLAERKIEMDIAYEGDLLKNCPEWAVIRLN